MTPSECGFELVLAAYLIHCIVASPSSWFTSVNAYFISISLLVSNDIEDSLHRSLVSLLTLNDLVSPTLTTTETACSKHSLKKNISSSLLNGLRCRLRYALPSTSLPGRIPSHSWWSRWLFRCQVVWSSHSPHILFLCSSTNLLLILETTLNRVVFL